MTLSPRDVGRAGTDLSRVKLIHTHTGMHPVHMYICTFQCTPEPFAPSKTVATLYQLLCVYCIYMYIHIHLPQVANNAM